MTERDRLLELLKYAFWIVSGTCADYLLKQGLCVPPCKVGDKVYSVIYDAVTDERYIGTVETIAETGTKGFFICTDGFYEFTPYESIGKDVFLTREEAVMALKEREK